MLREPQKLTQSLTQLGLEGTSSHSNDTATTQCLCNTTLKYFTGSLSLAPLLHPLPRCLECYREVESQTLVNTHVP